jgi:threonine dehydrogenase-like Zn-dependent dehydrogenase
MKAAIFSEGTIKVGDFPDPTPTKGLALVRTLACGLCAADAHWLHLGSKIIDASKKYGGMYSDVDLSRPIVMGHEFVGEIIDYGPGSSRTLPIGTKIVAMPVVLGPHGHSVIGQAPALPGGFGELMLVDENMMIEVPDDVDDSLLALTEPFAVGLEHFRIGEATEDDTILVVGCGAIGMGVIAGAKLKGLGPIIASDFDPTRRELALAMGADAAIDPRESDPYAPIAGVSSVPPTLIYECVGSQGMLGRIMQDAPFASRIVVGGFGLEPELVYIPSGQTKRLKVFFASGEGPEDMALALSTIVDGIVPMDRWVGARIGLSDVGPSLLSMGDAGSPIRTVVDPRRL